MRIFPPFIILLALFSIAFTTPPPLCGGNCPPTPTATLTATEPPPTPTDTLTPVPTSTATLTPTATEVIYTPTPTIFTSTPTNVPSPTRWKPTDQHGKIIETLPVAGGAEYMRMRQTLIAIFATIMMISALVLVVHSIRLLLKEK